MLSISHSANANGVLQCVSNKYIFPEPHKSDLLNPTEKGSYKFDVITYGKKTIFFLY
jgi:hypothetical protein